MDFIEPILYIGISQSFFAGLLIATKRPFTIANKLMATWLFLFFFEMLFALVNRTILEFYSFPFIAFTFGPILYLYVIHLTESKRKFSYWNLLHFIPFLVFFAVSVIFREKPIFDDLSGFFISDKFISLRIVYGITFFLSISVYSILCFIMIRKHQKRLMDTVSYTSGRITLNWLKILSITFYVGYLVVFTLGGIQILSQILPFDPYITTFIFITFFSFLYSFYVIKQPEITEPTKNGIEVSDYPPEEKHERYARSGLKDEMATEYLDRLIEVMEREKLYLNSNLTINDLSHSTGIPKHHITEVLNEKHGRNFFTFINEYRIKEVISRIGDAKFQHYTLLALAFDSGFNSKSTFNTFFKAFTGKTPSQYKESLIVEKH
jgi:AraC-like DNA-binding protein